LMGVYKSECTRPFIKFGGASARTFTFRAPNITKSLFLARDGIPIKGQSKLGTIAAVRSREAGVHGVHWIGIGFVVALRRLVTNFGMSTALTILGHQARKAFSSSPFVSDSQKMQYADLSEQEHEMSNFGGKHQDACIHRPARKGFLRKLRLRKGFLRKLRLPKFLVRAHKYSHLDASRKFGGEREIVFEVDSRDSATEIIFQEAWNEMESAGTHKPKRPVQASSSHGTSASPSKNANWCRPNRDEDLHTTSEESSFEDEEERELADTRDLLWLLPLSCRRRRSIRFADEEGHNLEIVHQLPLIS